MKSYVLDACAVIALFRNETGAEKVAEIVNEAFNGESFVIINKINALEIYYDILRDYGLAAADEFLNALENLPISIQDRITNPLFKEAGRFKANYRISLADSIALAEASINNFILLTADHHEFDVIENSSKENITFCWIR